MIYLLKHKATGLIKIGCTDDFKTRFTVLKSEYGDLEVLGFIAGYENYENELHIQFNHLNVQDILKGREWFNPEKELLGFIDKHASMTIPLPIGERKRDKPMPHKSNDTYKQVRISSITKQAINMLAAEIQIATAVRISSADALQALVKIAFPEQAKDIVVKPHIQAWVDSQTYSKVRGSIEDS